MGSEMCIRDRAENLLEQSLAYNDMKASDDCTVLVLGLFDTYEK